MQKEQERNQHGQPEKQQFGLCGAHGLKSTFSGRRFKSEVRLTGGRIPDLATATDGPCQ
jgi:hypothetical protein